VLFDIVVDNSTLGVKPSSPLMVYISSMPFIPVRISAVKGIL
jgi:hypothetical protein